MGETRARLAEFIPRGEKRPALAGRFCLYCSGRRVACFGNDHALASRELEIALRSGMVRA